MSEEPPKSDYPIWEGWYSVARPINIILPWAIIGLSVVGWVLAGLVCVLGICTYTSGVLLIMLPYLIIGIVGAIIYLIGCYKAVANKELTKKMHIFLIIAEVLTWFGWYWAGVLMTVQFVMVGILSDKPLWVAFSEG